LNVGRFLPREVVMRRSLHITLSIGSLVLLSVLTTHAQNPATNNPDQVASSPVAAGSADLGSRRRIQTQQRPCTVRSSDSTVIPDFFATAAYSMFLLALGSVQIQHMPRQVLAATRRQWTIHPHRPKTKAVPFIAPIPLTLVCCDVERSSLTGRVH
jgi:hypothetical protein